MAAGREHFGSSTAATLAMAGSAIGLGNIWRFPYMVGEHGGAVFIVVYLLSALLLSLPIMLSEAVIGKATHAGTFGAMERLAPGSRWKWLGLLTVITPMIILSYYSVVGGWSLRFFGEAMARGFDAGAESFFGRFIASAWGPLACHTLFLALTAGIVLGGVKSGIERFNKISLPLLFALMLVLMGYSLSLPGSRAGVAYLLRPDFSKLSPSLVAAAMGQSFFSLSLGVGTILTYASYMKKEDSILRTGIGTAGFDLLFALIAGFVIMPAVFAAGIQPDAGPGLIFETLPFIFTKMGAGAAWLSRAVSILFFFSIVIAALTSSISMFEVGVAYLVEERKMSRTGAVLLLFVLTWSLGALCSLSFGPLSGTRILGERIFDLCDRVTSDYLMTFGSLLFVLFAGWKMDRARVGSELGGDGRLFGVLYFLIRYVAPLAIVAIFISNLIL